VTADETSIAPAGGVSSAGDPDRDFAALAPGRMVGRYEILSILGQGGFGMTYRARDDRLHRDVAIKEYLPSALAVRQDGVSVLPRSTKVAEDFAWGRQRFVDEGRTLATLQRAPAIVRVFDFLEANGTAYIVMELVPGDTLESRLKAGPLSPAEVDRILWPLLDGLEQVHGTGFLHRDIKPANILLDAEGRPTLIDFGASRIAMAGRTAAMTAIFTPGYAAAEQMTSARQGPWTDIYGVAATLHHAIAGSPPPGSFDRALDDEYVALGQRAPAGFAPALLAGIDAGLALRAADRPQSIADWRRLLGRPDAPDAQATVIVRRAPVDPDATVVMRQPTVSPAPESPSPSPPLPAASGKGVWIGLVALVAMALGGGGYWMATRAPAIDAVAVQKADALGREQAARRQAEDAELAQLRDEKAAREKAAQDLEQRQKIETELRQKLAAEQEAKARADADARARAEAEEAARQKALEGDKTRAMATETALGLTPLDRQHLQVALTALGLRAPGPGADGVFGPKMREVIAAWQKSRSYPDTGYITGPQNQELLRAASAAIARFDDDQKKADEAKKKADEEKARAEAAKAPPGAAAPPQLGAAAPSQLGAAAPPQPVAPIAAGSPDGRWTGSYSCTASFGGGPFTVPLNVEMRGGVATWTRPNATATTRGNQSITVRVTGKSVVAERVYSPMGGANQGSTLTSSLAARFEDGKITGSGSETPNTQRTCTLLLTR